MKVTIYITGQINGNSHLATSINGAKEVTRTMFNGYALKFETKGEAVKAIREAYNSLCQDEPELKGRLGGIRVTKDRDVLYYDASKAIIETN